MRENLVDSIIIGGIPFIVALIALGAGAGGALVEYATQTTLGIGEPSSQIKFTNDSPFCPLPVFTLDGN